MLHATLAPEKVKEYARHHRGVWPEVQRGLTAHGVDLLSIWQDPGDATKIFLYVEMREGTTLDDLGPGSAYRGENPHVLLWETGMETGFHGGWSEMKELYALRSCGSGIVLHSTNSQEPLRPL